MIKARMLKYYLLIRKHRIAKNNISFHNYYFVTHSKIHKDNVYIINSFIILKTSSYKEFVK